MEYKEQIETLLLDLKKLGYDRRRIERTLDYSENYIDQQISKGGNKRLVNQLEKLQRGILEKAIPEGPIKIPDAMQYLTEKVMKIEAGMEVERSLLIDLLAQATGKTTTEISTKVAEALDYQISKRLAELKLAAS